MINGWINDTEVSFWVAAYRFTWLKTDEANADRHCKGCCCDVNLTCNLSENIEHNMYY